MPTVAARARRDARIRELTAEGLSRRAVAKRVGLSAAGVQNVLASARIEPALVQQQRAVVSAPDRPQAPDQAERQGGVIDAVVIEPRSTMHYVMPAPGRIDVNTTLADSAVEVELAEMRARQDRRIAAAQAETALCEAETARIRADMAARKLANAERLRQRRLWDAADRLREGYVTFGVALPPEALR